MILLKILFILLDLIMVIGLVIGMLKEDSIAKKIGITIVAFAVLLRCLYILLS